MSKEFEIIAEAHVRCFIAAKGDLAVHAEVLEQVFPPHLLAIGGFALIADPAARAILVREYRKVVKFHNFYRQTEESIAYEIAKQINHARSVVKFGMTGYLDD